MESAQDTVNASTIKDSTDASLTKELATLHRQLRDATIVAGQSGTVTALSISEGGRANGKLMVISDPTALQVSVAIKEKDILKLKEGMKAKITTDAIDGKTFSGTVVRVINFTTDTQEASAEGSTTSAATKYSADITMDDPGELLLGMSVKAEIALSESKKQLAVPYDSIVTEGDVSYILVAVAQGDTGDYTVQRLDVTTGASNDYYTGIKGDGLKKGLLVLSEPQNYEEGQTITVMDVGDVIESELEGGDE